MARTKRHSYQSATWRLIHDFDQPGPAQMARDEAILAAVAAGTAKPTIRFYSCAPPCLSIGAEQPADIVDEDACAAEGWDIVRRPTAGRAILHIDELAYSLILPLDDERGGGKANVAFDHLTGGILAGLKSMGLNPRRARPYYQDHGETGVAAFDGPDELEISMGGRKLIAQSQVVHEGALLQQGSLPLFGDTTRVAQALYFDFPGQRAALAARMRYRATNLLLYLGQKLSPSAAAAQLTEGLSTALNLELVDEGLTSDEEERAAILVDNYQTFQS